MRRQFVDQYSIAWHLCDCMVCKDCDILFTGSIARIAKRWYISYSEGDFEVFHRTGVTRWSTPPCQISPHRCKDKGMGPQN